MSPKRANTDQALARLAEGLLDCMANMWDARVEYAAEHGLTVTDDEIYASVRASILRMIREGK